MPDSIPRGRFLRAVLDLLEESGTFRGIVPELVTEDPKSGGRVIKAARGLLRSHVFEEIAAEGFVLAVGGAFGRKEEIRIRRLRYPISSTDSHATIMLHLTPQVKQIVLLDRSASHILWPITASIELKGTRNAHVIHVCGRLALLVAPTLEVRFVMDQYSNSLTRLSGRAHARGLCRNTAVHER